MTRSDVTVLDARRQQCRVYEQAERDAWTALLAASAGLRATLAAARKAYCRAQRSSRREERMGSHQVWQDASATYRRESDFAFEVYRLRCEANRAACRAALDAAAAAAQT